MRLPDTDLERFLKLFTFIPVPEIQQLMKTHNDNPSARTANHRLAFEFVRLIHGPDTAKKAETQHRSLFAPDTLQDGPPEPPSKERPVSKTGFINPALDPTAPQTNLWTAMSPHQKLPRSLVEGQFFHKIMWSAGLVSSKQEGFRLIVKGGCHVGCRPDAKREMGDALDYIPIKTWNQHVTKNFLIDDKLLILKVGKWKVKIIQVVSDEEFEAMGLTAPGWKDEQEESTYERIKDKELIQSKKKIKGHKVRDPFTEYSKPAIISLERGPDGNLKQRGDQ
jgi:tyrosyl-tRNA synthetase